MYRLCLLVLMTSILSGCKINDLLQPPPGVKSNKGTTIVDAVEGDKAKADPQESGNPLSKLTDNMRGEKDPVAGDPAWAPIHPTKKSKHYAASTGSLFSDSNQTDLYDDSKPHDIGDIITVNLDESTNASKSANADMTKSNKSSMDPLDVGGQKIKIGGKYTLSYDLNNKNSFAGDTSANQSNSISGYITVQVTKVLANGNLMIRGEKWMTLNTGQEYIRLSGTIRPEDIKFDNTIASNRVSDARIQYSGTGNQKDTQKPGFLARFFNIAL